MKAFAILLAALILSGCSVSINTGQKTYNDPEELVAYFVNLNDDDTECAYYSTEYIKNRIDETADTDTALTKCRDAAKESAENELKDNTGNSDLFGPYDFDTGKELNDRQAKAAGYANVDRGDIDLVTKTDKHAIVEHVGDEDCDSYYYTLYYENGGWKIDGGELECGSDASAAKVCFSECAEFNALKSQAGY